MTIRNRMITVSSIDGCSFRLLCARSSITELLSVWFCKYRNILLLVVWLIEFGCFDKEQRIPAESNSKNITTYKIQILVSIPSGEVSIDS